MDYNGIGSPRQQNIEKLRDLIKGINIAMLTTLDSRDGTLRSRPMATQEMEFDGELWFFTDGDSAKVLEIEREQQVNVSYADNGRQRYVSVSGTAFVVQDRAKMQELWNPMLKAWFPDGIDTPGIALLRIDVEKAEYWEGSSRIAELLAMAKAAVTGDSADDELGKNEKIQLQ
ncbi:MAG: pyridoxamine 5'-phosphate oxidase family protein [bacterium]|nr:pyridoxamine 5'-phosphate oxidase family protein [bacterium]